MGHPTAAQLIEAVQLFLKDAEGALSGRLQFHARVAGNALAIVHRELAQQPDAGEAEALAPFGGVASLCDGLRNGTLDPEDKTLLAALRRAALARLAVDNPRYPTFGRLSEREIT